MGWLSCLLVIELLCLEGVCMGWLRFRRGGGCALEEGPEGFPQRPMPTTGVLTGSGYRVNKVAAAKGSWFWSHEQLKDRVLGGTAQLKDRGKLD